MASRRGIDGRIPADLFHEGPPSGGYLTSYTLILASPGETRKYSNLKARRRSRRGKKGKVTSEWRTPQVIPDSQGGNYLFSFKES